MQCCTVARLYLSEVVKRMRAKTCLWERQNLGNKKWKTTNKMMCKLSGNGKERRNLPGKGGFPGKGISITRLLEAFCSWSVHLSETRPNSENLLLLPMSQRD